MNIRELRRRRLSAQHIATPSNADVGAVVAHLGAVQAQDLPAASWALGLRTRGAMLDTVQSAVAARTIVRTWPMRGTLHFVAAADVHWMLGLLTPRPIAAMAGRLRQLQLTDHDLGRSHEVVCTTLMGGRAATRMELFGALRGSGIDASGQRGIHILGWLAHHAVICHGPLAGKQPTFVLLDEWVARPAAINREEALSRLAERYFSGHGPATDQDFAWWSGLRLSDARAGLRSVADRLEMRPLGDTEYWRGPVTAPPVRANRAHLLPGFDEYLLGYRDRSAVLDPLYRQGIVPGDNGMFRATIVFDGRVVGAWRRRPLVRDELTLELEWFTPPSAAARAAIDAAGRRYARFLGHRLAGMA